MENNSNDPQKFPLSNHSIYRGKDVDHARDILSSLYAEVTMEPFDSRGSFSVRVNGVQLPRSSLVFTRFKDGCIVKSKQSLDFHAVQWASSGATTFFLEDEEVIASGRKTLVLSAGKNIGINCTPMNHVFGYVIKDSVLREVMSTWTGQELTRPIVFRTQIDATQSRIASFMSLLDLFISELSQSDGLLKEPAVIANFENTLITAMLFGLEHNLSEALRRPTAEVGCRQVRLVEEYIKVHAAEPIDMSTIAKVSGCSVSSIYRAFRRHRSYTPMKFLQDTRMGIARQRLLQTRSERSVTSIALESGFAHLGRFALEYKRRFHESPSQTLAHAKELTKPVSR